MKKYIITFLVVIGIGFAFIPHNEKIPTDVMYNGSPNREISIFEPRKENTRDESEGDVIFASPSIAFASCYLFRWDDSWVHQSVTFGDKDMVSMVIADRERFNKADSGGAIYLVSPRTFAFDKNKGIGIYEWISKIHVPALAKIEFASALEAMQKFGVKIYFVDEVQFKKYLSLPGEMQDKFLEEFSNDKTSF